MRILRLILFILITQSCTLNKSHFVYNATAQSHITVENANQDSILTKKFDFKENTEHILSSSVDPEFTRNLRLNNSGMDDFEADTKSDKGDVKKYFVKPQKLNFIQKSIVKKIEKRVNNKGIFSWNNYLFWLYVVALSLISVFSLIFFYGFKIGILSSILGGFLTLIGILTIYVTVINPTALR